MPTQQQKFLVEADFTDSFADSIVYMARDF